MASVTFMNIGTTVWEGSSWQPENSDTTATRLDAFFFFVDWQDFLISCGIFQHRSIMREMGQAGRCVHPLARHDTHHAEPPHTMELFLPRHLLHRGRRHYGNSCLLYSSHTLCTAYRRILRGFRGDLALQFLGSDMVRRVLGILLTFAPFSGIGIKTVLGMGAVETTIRESRINSAPSS